MLDKIFHDNVLSNSLIGKFLGDNQKTLNYHKQLSKLARGDGIGPNISMAADYKRLDSGNSGRGCVRFIKHASLLSQ